MDNWDQIITQNASQQTLEAFLAPLNLGTDRNYSQFLISIGYGDVNEFGRFDQEDRKTFEMLAIDKGMEDWKAFKISRNMKHFAKAHQSGWLVGDEQGGTQPLYAPPPAQPQAGSSPQQDGAPPAAPQPPGATEPEEQRKRLHAERVKEWLAGTPGGNRPVYGRDNGSLGLQPWQIALNEAACRLAIEQPWLVRFEGKRPKVGELQKAAGTIAAEGFGFAKKNGSRAGGAQGEAGKRAAPEKAAGGPARRPAVSITPNQRDARLMLIPKLMSDIDDMISALTKQKDEFIAANNSAAAITVINTLSEKRVEKTALQEELRQLQAKGKKAATDKRRSAGEGALLEQLSTPEVSAENIPAATTSELETVKRLADQLAVKDSFAKESTEIGRLRVSPIEGITLEEYIMAARHLCSARGHNDKTRC